MNSRRNLIIPVLTCAFAPSAAADELLFDYNADVHPADFGFIVANDCEPGLNLCEQRVDGGAFVIEWFTPSGDNVDFNFRISDPDDQPPPPPPPFWVEFRFASNVERVTNSAFCNGRVLVVFEDVIATAQFFGGIAFTGAFQGSVTLDPADAFHTFRFESPDGLNWEWFADGQVFESRTGIPGNGDTLSTAIAFGGNGNCDEPRTNRIQRWDHVRYGRLGEDEAIVAADPPAGDVDASFSRFSLRFDAPNYVHVHDVTVRSDVDPPPAIAKTWRLDHHGPAELEIVLDRALQIGETVTFTIGDPKLGNSVTYGVPRTGACCDRSPGAGGFCEDGVLEEECPVEFTLAATCDAVECVETTGACCDELSCTCAISLVGDCTGTREGWTEGATCSADPCDCATGACCDREQRACTENVTRPDCLGDWFESLSCDEVDADPETVCRFTAIPTVSTWGLGVLALSLLIAAKILSRRSAGA